VAPTIAHTSELERIMLESKKLEAIKVEQDRKKREEEEQKKLEEQLKAEKRKKHKHRHRHKEVFSDPEVDRGMLSESGESTNSHHHHHHHHKHRRSQTLREHKHAPRTHLSTTLLELQKRETTLENSMETSSSQDDISLAEPKNHIHKTRSSEALQRHKSSPHINGSPIKKHDSTDTPLTRMRTSTIALSIRGKKTVDTILKALDKKET